ncbi:hypothetical protein [Streptomyces sp. NPDC058045]|uniref:hypothetical protein n=1 Tax=Streptomyces sp. NPDC058045 TaxID=3346311 RepID=UPI0036F05957
MSRPTVPPAGPGGWSMLDEHLWYTCDIVADLLEGSLERRPLVATAARMEPGDRALAVGPAQRLTWRALGDGRYTQTSTFAFGSSAFVLGSMAATAMSNASRRNAAAANAQPRWVPEGGGELTVTQRKIYFGHPVCWLDLGLSGLDSIDMAASDVFQCGFRDINNGRQMLVQLHTPWASLLFVLAALTSFPAHPRLLSHGWLPPDFQARCDSLGRPCRPAPRLILERGTG